MDLSSILLLGALLVGSVFVLGGDRARARSDRLLGALANAENGVRAFYARLAAKAVDLATPWSLRRLLRVFVRVSHQVWLAVALVFVLLAFYGKSMRGVARYLFS